MSVKIKEVDGGSAIIELSNGQLVVTTKRVATEGSTEDRVRITHKSKGQEYTGEVSIQEAEVLASVLEGVSGD